jgi:hypothetical protein
MRDLDRIHDDAALIRADRGHRSAMAGSKSESEAIVESPPRRRWQGKSGGETTARLPSNVKCKLSEQEPICVPVA